MVDLRATRTAAGGGIILAASFAATASLNYGFGIALAWLLPESEFGIFSVLQNILVLAGSLLAAGYPWVLAKVVAQEAVGAASAGRADSALRSALVGNLALGLALATAYVTVQATTGRVTPGVTWTTVALTGITISILALNCISAAVLHGARRFDALGLMRTSEVVTKVLIGVSVGGLVGLGALGAALGFLLGGVVAAVCSWWALRDRLPSVGPLRGEPILASALPTGIGTSGFGLLMTLDVLMLSVIGIGHSVTYAVIATYQVASILARAPYFLGEALADALFPFIAAERMRPGAHAWFLAGFRWIPIALVPLQLVLLIAPEPALGTFFPAGYGDAANLVRLITVGTIGLIIADLLLKALYARELAVPASRHVVLAVAVELAGLLLLVPALGAIGAAIAAIAGHWSCAVLLAIVYLKQVRPIRPVRVPASTVVAYGAAISILAFFLFIAKGLPGPIGFMPIAAGLLGYLVIAYRTRIITTRDVRRLQSLIEPVSSAVHSLVMRLARLKGRSIAAVCVLLVALTMLWNLRGSPDTQYDEVVYTRAAQEVAQTWQLTWTNSPIFIHPPVSFLIQGAWLRLFGLEYAQLVNAIMATRVLTALITIANVLLLARLVGQIVPRADSARKRFLVIIVAAIAAVDPVLLRYGRLAIIEPFALLGCLLTLSISLVLQNRPARLYVPIVGIATGLTLLTKEVAVFLLLTPLLHGVITRQKSMIFKSAGAFAVGLSFWMLFPLWAAQLGLLPKFLDVKFVTFERLLGVLQYSGWNRPGVSFVSAISAHAGQYASSYVLLAGGALGLLWLLLNRLDASASWLLAFLLTSYGFGAYIVLLGTLNEQFFVYVLPAGLIGSVLVGDALIANRHTTRLPLSGGRTLRPIAAGVGSLALVFALGLASWTQSYLPDNSGLIKLTAHIRMTTPTCSAINVTGDPEKYFHLLPHYTITQYGTAEGALNHGVHLFVLSDKDVASGYGDSTQELTSRVRAAGTLLAAFPSATYGGLEFWHVAPDPHAELMDIEPAPGGVFVNTDGSRCGGFPVRDVDFADFLATWTDVGGKGAAGPPVTRSWIVSGRFYQAFDGVVLTAAPNIDTGSVPVVQQLSERSPVMYRQAGLPPITTTSSGSEPPDDEVLAKITDPVFRSLYLGVIRAPSDRDEAISRSRTLYGDPLGPAVQMSDGRVRQAFTGAVLERTPESSQVRLAPVGRLAVQAELVIPTGQAVDPADPPAIAITDDLAQPEPTTIEPFVMSLSIALALSLMFTLIVNVPVRRWSLVRCWVWLGRRRAPRSPNDA